MNIALFYLAKARFGGWVTFTAHLAKAFEQEGHSVQLFKVGKRSESNVRAYGYGLVYRNVSEQEAFRICKRSDYSLVTAADKSASNLICVLSDAGISLVVHDPAEMKKGLIEASKACRSVITIREANVLSLSRLGVPSHFIQHPYIPAKIKRSSKYHAVSFSRVDWDKHTDIICEANQHLPPKQQIEIFGAENRLFTHHKLNSMFPLWRKKYHGQFPAVENAGVVLSSKSIFTVDMSIIAGDGDGTQYTFLEAWDGGSVLVVNKEWIRTGKGVVQPDKTALVVENAEQLVDVLQNSFEQHEEIISNSKKILENHRSDLIIPRYLDVNSRS